MTEGLVTRIGKWIDSKWEAKATESKVLAVVEVLEGKIAKLHTDIELLVKVRSDDKLEKEVADLKTRLEKMELYSGMTRKVDPTKPPVVKSAFQM